MSISRVGLLAGTATLLALVMATNDGLVCNTLKHAVGLAVAADLLLTGRHMSATEAKVWRNLMLFIGISSAIFLALLVLLNILLNRYVISPVNRMAKIAEAYSMGDTSNPEFQYEGTDEVASLARSFNRMRRSLDYAMKELEK